MTELKPHRNNYILIDFENVQPASFKIPPNLNFNVILLVGAKQTKIPIELVRSMQQLGNNAKYITINGSGKNALDFHLTFYLGKLYEKDPTAFFHIISKDTGYDLLIDHLKSEKALVNRYATIEDIPVIKKSQFNQLPHDEQVSVIIDYFTKKQDGKPAKIDKLTNVIMSLSGRTLNENQIKGLIETLVTKGFIHIKGTQVSYQLTASTPKPPTQQIGFNAESSKKQIELLTESLIKKGTSRPRKVDTLVNELISFSKRSIDKGKAMNLINILKQKKLITITDTKVTYQLTKAKPATSVPQLFKNMVVNKQIELIVSHLIKRGVAKPKKVETLSNTIISLSGKTVLKKKADSLVNVLSQKKLITITDSRITYQLKS